MTPSEIISTSLAGVALIVAWLARQDSNKLAQEARRANELVARQLELVEKEQNRQAQKEAAENRPLLAWRAGGPDGEAQYFEFLNQGAVISNAKVIVDNGLEGFIAPKEVLATGQCGRLLIKYSKKQQLPKTVKCSIEYSDKHNERRKIDLRLLRNAVGNYFDYPPELA